MSKILRSNLLFFVAFAQILQFFTNIEAQDIETTIRIDANSPSVARVQGRFLHERSGTPANRISFMSDYAGTFGIYQRISDIRLADSKGGTVFNRGIPGEYLAVSGIKAWSYSVDLAQTKSFVASAHVSWLSGDGGILMPDDFLPQDSGKFAKIKIELPTGWKLYSTEKTIGVNEFEVANIEKACFFISRNWREKTVTVGDSSVKVLLSGDWLFADDEAATIAAEVFGKYEKLFGSAPRSSQIALVKFPWDVQGGHWEADTRGSSITIASSDMPFKSQSIQRLHEQFRHEIFHMWAPASLNLTGHYDWFYEGFALYQSLKLGVEVNRIRFEDMLDTLSRASSLDRGFTAMSMPKPRSLIDLSKNRWMGGNTQVYARGMIVAFLCDLALLNESNGKRSTSDLVREIYSQHGGAIPASDGNTAILSIFKSHKELIPIADRYISGTENIEWGNLLNAAGLDVDTKDQVTKLTVKAKPSGRQKDLLDKLGYNNWRKLTVNNR